MEAPNISVTENDKQISQQTYDWFKTIFKIQLPETVDELVNLYRKDNGKNIKKVRYYVNYIKRTNFKNIINILGNKATHIYNFVGLKDKNGKHIQRTDWCIDRSKDIVIRKLLENIKEKIE